MTKQLHKALHFTFYLQLGLGGLIPFQRYAFEVRAEMHQNTSLPGPIIGVAVKENGVYCVVKPRHSQLSQFRDDIWYVSPIIYLPYLDESTPAQPDLVTFLEQQKVITKAIPLTKKILISQCQLASPINGLK